MRVVNPGCRSDYKTECRRDFSDNFICPASACQIGSNNFQPKYSELFPCQDGKYCIWQGLVCDGYAQCEDESGKEASCIAHILTTTLNLYLTCEIVPFHG